MRGALPSLSQNTFMAWCSVKALGQLYLYIYLDIIFEEAKENQNKATILCNEGSVVAQSV
jgi:hypothetical protein